MAYTVRAAEVGRVMGPQSFTCPTKLCQGDVIPCGDHKQFTMVTLSHYEGEINCWLCTKCGSHWRIGKEMS
jgi:hypothetical protein